VAVRKVKAMSTRAVVALTVKVPRCRKVRCTNQSQTRASSVCAAMDVRLGVYRSSVNRRTAIGN